MMPEFLEADAVAGLLLGQEEPKSRVLVLDVRDDVSIRLPLLGRVGLWAAGLPWCEGRDYVALLVMLVIKDLAAIKDAGTIAACGQFSTALCLACRTLMRRATSGPPSTYPALRLRIRWTRSLMDSA